MNGFRKALNSNDTLMDIDILMGSNDDEDKYEVNM